MTGEGGNIRVNIDPTIPVLVVQSVHGNLIAIIDRMGYIRQILNSWNQIVQVHPRREFRTSVMDSRHIRQYGIVFNVIAPLPHSDSDK